MKRSRSLSGIERCDEPRYAAPVRPVLRSSACKLEKRIGIVVGREQELYIRRTLRPLRVHFTVRETDRRCVHVVRHTHRQKVSRRATRRGKLLANALELARRYTRPARPHGGPKPRQSITRCKRQITLERQRSALSRPESRVVQVQRETEA